MSSCTESKVERVAPRAIMASKDIVSDTIKTVMFNECEQFLRDYEKWVKNYIILIERYQQNPNDKTIMKDYEGMVRQIRTWDIRSRTCINDTAILHRYFQLQELLKEHAKKVLWK
jgi:hypothetical protein